MPRAGACPPKLGRNWKQHAEAECSTGRGPSVKFPRGRQCCCFINQSDSPPVAMGVGAGSLVGPTISTHAPGQGLAHLLLPTIPPTPRAPRANAAGTANPGQMGSCSEIGQAAPPLAETTEDKVPSPRLPGSNTISPASSADPRTSVHTVQPPAPAAPLDMNALHTVLASTIGQLQMGIQTEFTELNKYVRQETLAQVGSQIGQVR